MQLNKINLRKKKKKNHGLDHCHAMPLSLYWEHMTRPAYHNVVNLIRHLWLLIRVVLENILRDELLIISRKSIAITERIYHNQDMYTIRASMTLQISYNLFIDEVTSKRIVFPWPTNNMYVRKAGHFRENCSPKFNCYFRPYIQTLMNQIGI